MANSFDYITFVQNFAASHNGRSPTAEELKAAIDAQNAAPVVSPPAMPVAPVAAPAPTPPTQMSDGGLVPDFKHATPADGTVPMSEEEKFYLLWAGGVTPSVPAPSADDFMTSIESTPISGTNARPRIMGYADGGFVDPYAAHEDELNQFAAPAPIPAAAPMPSAEPVLAQGPVAAPMPVAPTSEYDASHDIKKAQDAAPAQGQDSTVPPGMMPVSSTTTSSVLASPDYNKIQGEVDTSTKDAQSATNSLSKKQQEAYSLEAMDRATAKVKMDALVREEQEHQDEVKKNTEVALVNIQALQDHYAQQKVDPSKWYTDRGTWGIVGAAISMALGAYGAAITGTQNFAAETIKNAIDRDIRAQEVNLEKAGKQVDFARAGLSDYMKVTSDWREALQMKKASMLQAAQEQIDADVAAGKAAMAPDVAKQASAQIGLEKAKTQANVAASIGARTTVSDEQTLKVNPYAEVQVPGYQINPTAPPTKEQKQKFSDFTSDAANLQYQIQNFKDFISKNGVYNVIPGTTAHTDARAKYTQLVESIKKLDQTGRFAEYEFDKLFNKQIPDADSLFKVASRAGELKKLDILAANTQNALQSKAHAYGYIPVQQQQKSVNFKPAMPQ